MRVITFGFLFRKLFLCFYVYVFFFLGLRPDLPPLLGELQPQAAAPSRDMRRDQRAHHVGRPAAVFAPGYRYGISGSGVSLWVLDGVVRASV